MTTKDTIKKRSDTIHTTKPHLEREKPDQRLSSLLVLDVLKCSNMSKYVKKPKLSDM